jgi:hypothetical protein
MPPVFDDPVAERRGRRPQQHNGGQQRRERVAFSPNARPHHLRPEPRIIIVRPEPDSAFR